MSTEPTPTARETAEKIARQLAMDSAHIPIIASIIEPELSAALTRSEEEKKKLNTELAHWKAVANYYRPQEQQQKESPCAICYHMFAPEFMEDNTCSLCLNRDLSTLTARLKEAEELFRRVYHVFNWSEPIEAETCGGFVSLEESSDNFEEVKEDVLTFLSASTPVEKKA